MVNVAVPVAVALILVGVACNVPAQPPTAAPAPVAVVPTATSVPAPIAAPPTPSPTASVRPELVEGRAPVAVALRGRVYRLEVVRAGEPGYFKGLGERDALPLDRGMLFLESQDVAMTFWMKGMRFPLDLIWIDRAGRIVHVERNVPHQPGVPHSQLPIYRPPRPSRAVLELNAGQADAHGFQVGDQALFSYD